MEEERRGQSSRFKGPGMDGKLGLAMGQKLGAALEASEVDGKLGLAMGMKLGAALEVSEVDGRLGFASGVEMVAGVGAIGWMLDGMSGAGTKWLLDLEVVFESWRSLGLVVLLESWWNHVAVGLKTATSTPCGRSCWGIVFHVLILRHRPQCLQTSRQSGDPVHHLVRLVAAKQGCPDGCL